MLVKRSIMELSPYSQALKNSFDSRWEDLLPLLSELKKNDESAFSERQPARDIRIQVE
jgi:hypothetical protein